MALETLKSSCSHYNGRRLWLGKAALRSRLVDVRGWRGGRRFRDSIPLEEVESVARSNSKAGGNLVFAMQDGSERSLRVSAPGIWRMQIDYRLRRIAGLGAEAPEEATKASTLKLDSSLPTADDVEHPMQVEAPAVPEEKDHESELAAWPRFETEEATIEIVAGDDLEPEFLIEPVAVSEEGVLVPAEPDPDLDLAGEAELDEPEEVALVDALSFEIEAEEGEEEIVLAGAELEIVSDDEATVEVVADAEAVSVTDAVAEAEAEAELTEPEVLAEARIISVPPPEDLHEIGDDVVFDMAMDATTHEDVVIGWLSNIDADEGGTSSAATEAEMDETESSLAEDEIQADDDAEPVMADMEADLEVEAPVAEAEVESAMDVEPTVEAELTTGVEALPDLATEIEAELNLEPTLAEAALDGKPLIAEIEVEAPDLGIEAGLEVEPPELELEAEILIEDPTSSLADAPVVDVIAEAAAEADLTSETEPEPVAELEPEPVPIPEPMPAPAAETEPETALEPEPATRLTIASRPFELSRLYESADSPEDDDAALELDPAPQAMEPEPELEPEPEPELQAELVPEPEPEPQHEPAQAVEPEQPAPAQAAEPEISIEPVTKRERRRRQSMADLRPMSLAELIRQSEPTWTRLAEMD